MDSRPPRACWPSQPKQSAHVRELQQQGVRRHGENARGPEKPALVRGGRSALFGHRSRTLQMGYDRDDFMGKPVIGIINTWSDLNAVPHALSGPRRGH